MFHFIILIVKIFFLPLSSIKKEIVLKILTLKKENHILVWKLHSNKMRIRFSQKDRLFYSIINKFSEKMRSLFLLVSPEKSKKRGRPRTPQKIKQLILKMKNENISWGNGKIQGELKKLGIELDKRTIAKIINDFRRLFVLYSFLKDTPDCQVWCN